MAKYCSVEFNSNFSKTAIRSGTCNCCREPIVKGIDIITGSWMGWIHEHCRGYMLNVDHFMYLQRRLQKLNRIPAEGHLYQPFLDFVRVEAVCEAMAEAEAIGIPSCDWYSVRYMVDKMHSVYHNTWKQHVYVRSILKHGLSHSTSVVTLNSNHTPQQAVNTDWLLTRSC